METFYWTTEHWHFDNNETMDEYLEHHLPEEFTIVYQDGTFSEIRNRITRERFEVHASGNGDSFNHKVEFVPLGIE